MGISLSGGDAFTYNRFESLEEAYRSLYEEKEEKDEDESEEKKMNPFQKKKHEEDESEEEEESEEEDDEDEDEESDEKEEKSDKKFPSFLKKSKEEKVEESVIIDYLLDEGFVNNEVSAEVMCKFMSEEWKEEILEGYKKLPVGKMMKQATRKGMRVVANAVGGLPSTKPRSQAAKKADVADKHDPVKVQQRRNGNSALGHYRRELESRRANRARLK